MIELILTLYAITVLVFFVITIKDTTHEYSPKTVAAFLGLSITWPIVLIIYYLDDKNV